MPTGNNELEEQLRACAAIGDYLAGKELIADTQVQQLVVGTLDRSTSTLASITVLISPGYTVQAAMLCRPLFEDMAVMHWLVLNEGDPDFLLERFHSHLEAMLVVEAETLQHHWDKASGLDEELLQKRDELHRRFGSYAEKDWWAVRPDGSRLSMPALLDEIAAAERFHPRLKGEEPILHQYYAYVHKWATQCLHHTAAGLPIALDPAGGVPRTVRPPMPVRVLSAAYWVYAQIVFLTLDVQGWDPAEFERIFLDGLYGAFKAPAA